MARFRKARRSGFRAKAMSSYRKASKPSLSVMDVLLAGAVYGAVRPTVANMLPTFFKFGPVDSDNVILGGAGYMASKSKTKFVKALGLVAMGTEAGIVTSNLLTSQTSSSSDMTNLSDL